MRESSRFATRVGIVRELLGFLWARKLWWLTPMVVVLVVFGLLLVFAQGSVLAPFIYPLFQLLRRASTAMESILMMAALRGMMLLLVTVFGYAAGVTSARRGAVPGLFDMGIVLSLWLLDLWMAPGIGHWQSVGLGLLAGATAGATRRLLAPGASAPRRPEAIELGWRAFMKEIGNYQGRLTLLFVYFVVVSPFALISRASSDPLRLRGSDPGSFWVDRASGDTTISAAKRQF